MAKVVKSEQYNLILQDLKKIGIGALIAGAGASLTIIAEQIPNVNFGEWTPYIVAFASILINIARKFLQETKY